MNWFKSSSNSFVVTYHNSYGELGVITDKGKEYEYTGVSPFIHNKIRRLVAQNRFGEGWQMLRNFSEREKK